MISNVKNVIIPVKHVKITITSAQAVKIIGSSRTTNVKKSIAKMENS